MLSAICSGKAVSSLPLSMICLRSFPAKQRIIYVSSIALFRLSVGMKTCNFLWAEIISSAPAPLHLLFSDVSPPTFCHRIERWWFAQGEDVHKDKSNKKLQRACDSQPDNFKWFRSFGVNVTWWAAARYRDKRILLPNPLTLLAPRENSHLKAPLISKSFSFTPRLLILGDAYTRKCMLYFKPMKEVFLKVHLSMKTIISCQISVGC